MRWLLGTAVIIWLIFNFPFGKKSGCEKYASEFSCKFVEDEARYEVYYYRYLSTDQESEQYLGAAVSIYGCLNRAVDYSIKVGEAWNERAYICVLNEDGRTEKHRFMP